jgi:hypothetical protein
MRRKFTKCDTKIRNLNMPQLPFIVICTLDFCDTNKGDNVNMEVSFNWIYLFPRFGDKMLDVILGALFPKFGDKM